MRVFVRSKIYRAFPELDAFSDERCQRFVRAAQRPFTFRLRRLLAALTTFLIIVVADYFVLLFLASLVDHTRAKYATDASMVFMAAFITTGFLVAGLAALRVRDWLLKRRLIHVLRTKGHCHSCGYLLAGVTVNAAHEVSCPECAYVSEVDPALGELASDAQGRTLYQPSEASLRRGPSWLTPARRRWLRRWAQRAAIALPVLLLVLLVSYEALLRLQAEAAARARPGPEGFLALQLSHLPPGVTPDAPNSWEVFESLHGRMVNLETSSSVPRPQASDGTPIYIDYASIGQHITGDTEQDQNARLAQAYSRALLSSFLSDPLFDDLQAMVHRPRHQRSITWPRSNPIAGSTLSYGSATNLRYLARLMTGRMDLALDHNNLAMFDQSLDIDFGLARMSMSQPTLIDYLVALAIEYIGQARMRVVLMDSPSEAWLDLLEPHAWRLLDQPDEFEFALRGEQLFVTDAICWAFEEPGRCRFGRFSSTLSNTYGSFGGLEFKRLGFYWENKSYVDRSFDAYITQAAQPPVSRVIAAGEDTSLLIPSALNSLIPNFANSRDQRSTDLAGTIAMIRIERYRLAHGHYPDSLDEVAAESPRPLPFDPYSGKLLGYKRVDPATDAHGRGYILYSVAADGFDNQGFPGKGRQLSPTNTPSGVDFIINDPNR